MKTEQEGSNYAGRLWPEGQKPLPPPPRGAGGRVQWAWRVGILAAVVTVLVVAVVSAGGSRNAQSADPSGGTDARSEEPATGVTDPQSPPQQGNVGASDDGATEEPVIPDLSSEVVGSFNALNGWSVGSDLRFGVIWLRYPWAKCYTHTFSTGGRPRGAFYTDCAWDDKDLAFFLLNFKNRSGHSIKLTRFNITLRAVDGRELTPVDVGAARKFLSKTRMLGWHSQWNAWVAFDNSGGDVHPVSVSYEIGDEVLVQTFDGSEGVVGPR